MLAMSRSKRLGLDELMIVNSGLRHRETYLLGDDNTLYRVDRLAENDPPSRFFLGDDGMLYEVIGAGGGSGVRRYGR
jgi:hypothetical protein